MINLNWNKEAWKRLIPSGKYLPEKLRQERPLHDDWPWPFCKIPRAWTTFDTGVPIMICGDQKLVRKDKTGVFMPGPIGEPGSWQISRYPALPFPFNVVPAYVAFTTKYVEFSRENDHYDILGTHYSIGNRRDDVDGYNQIPRFARKTNVDQNGDRKKDA